MKTKELSDLQVLQEFYLNLLYQFGYKEMKNIFRNMYPVLDFEETEKGFIVIDVFNPDIKLIVNEHFKLNKQKENIKERE